MNKLLPSLLFCFALSELSPAYVLEGGKLRSSPTNIQMKLSSTAGSLSNPPAFPLSDGSTSWEQVFTASANIWNAVMANMRLTTSPSPATNLGTEDGINEAYFGTSVGGFNLDSNTLGLTAFYSDGTTIFEADIAFNSNFPWNSYRGPLLSNGVIDFRRVAIHEIGHVLGLDDINGTNPPAIMDLVISNIDTLTTDDIAGAQFLYGAVPKIAGEADIENPGFVQFREAQSRIGLDGNLRVLYNIFNAPGATGYSGSTLWILDGNGRFRASGTPQIPASIGFGSALSGKPDSLVAGQASGNTTVAFLFPGRTSFGIWTYNLAGALISAAVYGPYANTLIQDIRFSPAGKMIVVWSSAAFGGTANAAWTLNEFGGIETIAGPFGPYAGTVLGKVNLGPDNLQRWYWNSPPIDGAPGPVPSTLAIWSLNVSGQVTSAVQY
jgi:hypothetical protein